MPAEEPRLTIRCSAEERMAWTRAAQAEGMTLSAWVRRALDRTAEDEEGLRAFAATGRAKRQRGGGLGGS